jgi:hypothetical protein
MNIDKQIIKVIRGFSKVGLEDFNQCKRIYAPLTLIGSEAKIDK